MLRIVSLSVFAVSMWFNSAVAASTVVHPFSSVSNKVPAEQIAFDLGSVLQGRDVPIENDVVLINASRLSVNIEKVTPACGCTSVVMDALPKGSLVRTINPGQSLHIHVVIDPEQLYPGKIDKAIRVFITGQAEPAATLHMTGTVERIAQFDPQEVDFGNINLGTSAVRQVSVTVDSRAYPHVPDLHPNDPDIRIVRIGAEEKASKGKLSQIFDVELATAVQFGRVQLRLSLPPIVGYHVPPRDQYIFVTGNVVGEIQCSSSIVTMGTLKSGVQSEQQVTITGKSLDLLKLLTVKADTPTVSAALSFPPTPGQPTQAVLHVKVTADTQGIFQSKLRIQTCLGHTLVLPIVGYVQL